jgi:hypothetical protein
MKPPGDVMSETAPRPRKNQSTPTPPAEDFNGPAAPGRLFLAFVSRPRIFTMTHVLRSLSPVLCAALAIFSSLLTGCSTGTIVLVPVMGGKEKVRVELTAHGPTHAAEDGFEIQFVSFVPNKAPKTPDFIFLIGVKDAKPPRSITVEDITDEASRMFLTDEAPKVTAGVWRGELLTLPLSDPRIEWIHRMNSEIRIFRFTIIAADGHRVVLDQASSFPTYIKDVVREAYGLKS